MSKIKEIVKASTQQKTEDKYEILNKSIEKIAEIEPEYKAMDKIMKQNKDTIKSLCTELNLDSYEACGKKITISHVDKSYLDVGPTLDWLRNNGFERFIKTREYFDELAMDILNEEIKS